MHQRWPLHPGDRNARRPNGTPPPPPPSPPPPPLPPPLTEFHYQAAGCTYTYYHTLFTARQALEYCPSIGAVQAGYQAPADVLAVLALCGGANEQPERKCWVGEDTVGGKCPVVAAGAITWQDCFQLLPTVCRTCE